MTLDEIRKIINEKLPVTDEAIAQEIAYCKEGFSDDNVLRITLICQLTTTLAKYQFLDPMREVAAMYVEENLDDLQKGHLYYVLATIYYLLGFPPKTVEYAEKYLLLPINNYPQAMLIYNYLTFAYKTHGYYQKTIEYSNKSLECGKKAGNVDVVGLTFLTHLNNMFTYISLKDTEHVKQEYLAFTDVIKSNPQNPYVQLFGYYIELSKIYYQFYFDQSIDVLNAYIKQIYKLEDNPNMYVTENIDSHLDIIKHLFSLEMYEECMRITKILLNSGFIGDKLDLYHYYLQAAAHCENKDEIEYEKMKDAYIAQLEVLKEDYRSCTRHLIDEQLNYLLYMNDYQNIKKKCGIDILTSCQNRPAFEQDFDVFMKENPQGCLVFIDLDHLKEINDAYGHHMGDLYLQTFVKEMTKHVKNEMSLYRYAGDEFILLSTKNIEETKLICDEAYQYFTQNVKLPGISLRLSFSYGMSPFIENAKIGDIIHEADQIMYEFKKKHHNNRQK